MPTPPDMIHSEKEGERGIMVNGEPKDTGLWGGCWETVKEKVKVQT